MSEEVSIIEPDSIPIEHPTEIIPGRDSQYHPPFSEENPFARHLVTIEGFDARSENMKTLNDSISIFKYDVKESSDINEDQIRTINHNLQVIRQNLLSNPEFQQEMQQISVSHEEAHRYHEIRFKLQEDQDIFQNLKVNKYEIIHRVRGSEIRFEKLDKDLLLYSIYSEAEATIAGLRNANASDFAKINHLEWRAAASFSMAYSEDMPHFLNMMYHNIQGGWGSGTYSHLMTDLMIAFEDPTLPLKIQSGEISIDDFCEQASVRMRELLLHPENLSDQVIKNQSFDLVIDQQLMNSVQNYKESLRTLQQIASTKEIEE